MRLSKKDQIVIERFTDPIFMGDAWFGRDLDGDNLSSDGEKLTTSGLGGGRIAYWAGSKIHFDDVGTQSQQAIQKAIRKAAPKNWLAETGEAKATSSKKTSSKKTSSSSKPSRRRTEPAKTFRVYANGVHMGDYAGQNENAALNAYARDAGFESFKALQREFPRGRDDWGVTADLVEPSEKRKKPAIKKASSKTSSPRKAYKADPKADAARAMFRADPYFWTSGELAQMSDKEVIKAAAAERKRVKSPHSLILDEINRRQRALYERYGKSNIVALPAGVYTIEMLDSDGETALIDANGGAWEPNSVYPNAGEWTKADKPILYEHLAEGDVATLVQPILYDREDAEVLFG